MNKTSTRECKDTNGIIQRCPGPWLPPGFHFYPLMMFRCASAHSRGFPNLIPHPRDGRLFELMIFVSCDLSFNGTNKRGFSRPTFQ